MVGDALVVHYWADLQSVHGLRCYGNITRTRNVSEYMLVLALCLVLLLIIIVIHFRLIHQKRLELQWQKLILHINEINGADSLPFMFAA